MPNYRVEAIEKFLVRTVYHVTADDSQAAERLCRTGQAAYDRHTMLEGGEEWIETVSVESADDGD